MEGGETMLKGGKRGGEGWVGQAENWVGKGGGGLGRGRRERWQPEIGWGEEVRRMGRGRR